MSDKYLRKVGLFIGNSTTGNFLDLSELRIRFTIRNADQETPDNAMIRVYNLSNETIQKIVGPNGRSEFTHVYLNAGYENGFYGIIFEGTVCQIRYGRENAIDSYMDILAANGDIFYGSVTNVSVSSKNTVQSAVNNLIVAANSYNQSLGANTPNISLGAGKDAETIRFLPLYIPLIRGVTLFGMARSLLRNFMATIDYSMRVEGNKLVITPKDGYISGGGITEINTVNGMVGVPEQTDQGVKVTCLLNPNIRIGYLIRLNNSELTRTNFIGQVFGGENAAAIQFNSWGKYQYMAPLSPDGLYRAFAVEHTGDTRGLEWYTHIIGLATDPTTKRTTDNG